MARLMTENELQLETLAFAGTGGISSNSRSSGFHPAFMDTYTQAVYLSRFLNGQPAPIHLLDGLPDDVVVTRGDSGRVRTVKATVVSGFVRDGEFYTRDEAAQRVAELPIESTMPIAKPSSTMALRPIIASLRLLAIALLSKINERKRLIHEH